MKLKILSAILNEKKKLEIEITNRNLFINDGLSITFYLKDGNIDIKNFYVSEINILENKVKLIEMSYGLTINKEDFYNFDFSNLDFLDYEFIGDVSNMRKKL